MIAFEPSPTVLAETRWHFEYNSVRNITLIELTIADQPGIASFDTQVLSTTGKLAESVASPGSTLTEVKVTTLDRVVAEQGIGSVSLIKVDVEGAESRVLAGATDTLARLRPRLIVELHNPEQDLLVSRLLRDADYRLTRLDGSEILKPDCGWPDRDGVWGTIIAHP